MNKDSVKNLAILSKDSYNVGSGQEQKETQMNLSIINQSNIDVIEKEINNYNGFQAKAYKNNDTGDIVISYAGTSLSSLNDLATDACIASGVRPSQVDDAISFYKRVKEEFCKDDPNIKITLTGHSLGGMLAIQVALDAYNKQLNDMGGVTKENFQNMKAQDKSLEVVAFEAPAIIMPSEYNNQIYDEYKDVLGLFGYKRSYTEDVPGLIYTLVYQPTDDSLDIHELGITSFQNANSVLTRASGLQVGVINLIDAPISHQHFMGDDNCKTAETTNRANVKNIYFDKTVNYPRLLR